MKGIRLFTVALALGLTAAIPPVLAQPSPTLSPSNSSTDRGFFLSPPRLVKAETTFNAVFSPNAVYFFTLEVPENAGSGLRQVQISQKDGSANARLVRYETDATQAFVGTPKRQGAALGISETRFDRDSQTLTVSFDPVVPPGTTVTLRLRPERNPRISGVYLFGVTAYPSDPNQRGQFLGFGRLHFYDNDSRPFF
jgi:hypothetical protein